MRATIFIDEERGTEHDTHPGYMAVEVDGDRLRVSVRESGGGGNHKAAHVLLTREQAANMATAALRFLEGK